MSAAYKPKPKTTAERKEIRNRMYAKIHAIWGNLRTDLRKGSEDYKEALYLFAEAELKKPQIGSFTELTQTELGKVIEALEREQKQPKLYQAAENVIEFKPKISSTDLSQPSGQAPVEHLASVNQRFAINRLFGYLDWGDYGREKFLKEKFRCKRVEMLLHKQAHSCIRILLNYAGWRYWKSQGKEKVSQPMIKAAIPKIKREIGIN